MGSKEQHAAITERIEKYINLDLSIKEMSMLEGVSYDTMRGRLTRRGYTGGTIRHHRDVTFRQRVERMDKDDAIQLLLHVVEATGAMRAESNQRHPLLNVLTPKQGQLFQLMYDNKGRLVSKNAAMDHIYALTPVDDVPEYKILDVLISKIRKELPKSLKIVTMRGEGWYLTDAH